MSTTITAIRVPNPAALEVLARAEKRLRGRIAEHGIDAETLAICATYERLYAQALTPAVDGLDETFTTAAKVVAA
ncbi:MAG: hypothetical protein M0Z51_16880 [Propionibacterium sp.]|nr:hypothetical protein [Propionibacterium sp.]